jgi:hypothetical protein
MWFIHFLVNVFILNLNILICTSLPRYIQYRVCFSIGRRDYAYKQQQQQNKGYSNLYFHPFLYNFVLKARQNIKCLRLIAWQRAFYLCAWKILWILLCLYDICNEEWQCVIQSGVRRDLSKRVMIHHSTGHILTPEVTCLIFCEVVWEVIIFFQSSDSLYSQHTNRVCTNVTQQQSNISILYITRNYVVDEQ